MGAKNTSVSNANYYGVAFGYLSTQQSAEPTGKEETTTAKLKAAMQAHQNLDLRNAYVRKDGKFPYQVFYQAIKGVVTKIEKVQNDNYGYQLIISMVDEDGENSIITIKFYTKYVENLLNRIININSHNLSFSPYSIPSEWEGKKFYSQGIVIYEDGHKVQGSIKAEDLPPVEEVLNTDGTKAYSRVKRINFLFEKAMERFNSLAPVIETAPAAALIDESDFDDDGDLPF